MNNLNIDEATVWSYLIIFSLIIFAIKMLITRINKKHSKEQSILVQPAITTQMSTQSEIAWTLFIIISYWGSIIAMTGFSQYHTIESFIGHARILFNSWTLLVFGLTFWRFKSTPSRVVTGLFCACVLFIGSLIAAF